MAAAIDPSRPAAVRPADVIAFWQAAGPARWFSKDDAFDAECRHRFLAVHERAAAGSLAEWRTTAEGSLALVILLDQMPRNMFRGDPRTWATDPLALTIADEGLSRGFEQAFDTDLRQFFSLPFMHSERLADQDRAVAIYERLGDRNALTFARHHRDIVARFGRFPHRNAVLGRQTTPEEDAFLETDPFRG